MYACFRFRRYFNIRILKSSLVHGMHILPSGDSLFLISIPHFAQLKTVLANILAAFSFSSNTCLSCFSLSSNLVLACQSSSLPSLNGLSPTHERFEAQCWHLAYFPGRSPPHHGQVLFGGIFCAGASTGLLFSSSSLRVCFCRASCRWR